VQAARKAVFEGRWSELTPTERGEYLFDLADVLESRVEEHAKLEVRENGKTISGMTKQHRNIPDWFRFYGGLADKIHGKSIPTRQSGMHVYTKREPTGVVAAITPWNSPLMLATWKLAPALAAGNGVVLKPDEHTSASALSFARAVDEIGFPDGAVNVITGYGDEVGEPLVSHDHVDKVSFTGGTETGAHVAASAAQKLTPSTMELGGKSPHIVFPDADLGAAVKAAIWGIFGAAGQSCSAGSRLLLHEEIADEFVSRIVERTEQITLGDPLDEQTDMGPLASDEQLERVQEYVDIGRQGGATLACGGHAVSKDGCDRFFSPTVFTDVDNDSRLAQEEIFGPVLAVIEYDSESAAIDLANDVDFGLAAGLWTADTARMHRLANEIRAGRIWVNHYKNSDVTAPQGGFKDSGWGRENGVEGIKEFLETKTVWIDVE
jgi:aldehyde dehydrogenase (NAD+)